MFESHPASQPKLLQESINIIKTQLRPSFHLIAFCLEFLTKNKLDLRDNLLVFPYLFRLAKQHMNNAKMHLPNFGRIVINQTNRMCVKFTLNNKFLTDLSLNSFLKCL